MIVCLLLEHKYIHSKTVPSPFGLKSCKLDHVLVQTLITSACVCSWISPTWAKSVAIDYYLWIVKNKKAFPCQTIWNCLQATDPENVMTEVVELFHFSLLPLFHCHWFIFFLCAWVALIQIFLSFCRYPGVCFFFCCLWAVMDFKG